MAVYSCQISDRKLSERRCLNSPNIFQLGTQSPASPYTWICPPLILVQKNYFLQEYLMSYVLTVQMLIFFLP